MFKVGDLVRCVTGTSCLKEKELYTISEVIIENRSTYVKVEGLYASYFVERFELINEINPETANTGSFFVFNMTTRGTPRKPHNTFAEAKAEANRLAEATPNQEFVVLEPTYSVKKVPQFVTEEQTYSISH